MKTKFNEFLKINENIETNISLIDIENIIENIFNDSNVQSVNTVYEKDNNNLKLVISINGLFNDKCNILHTKFIFRVDKEKTKLISNSFKYLYDINCNYKEIKFDSIITLEEKINNIIDNKNFGDDISNISNIFIALSTNINKKLEKENIYDISVYNVNYSPLTDIIPCKSFSFDFKINLNNVDNIKMNIRKISKNEFKYSFNNKDWNYDITKTDINSTIDIIVSVLKKYNEE